MVGCAGVFFKALTRKPIPDFARSVRASGPLEGIEPPNIPGEVWFLVQDLENPEPMVTALQTRIDYDGLLDLIEIKIVQRSWEHADALNQEAELERMGVPRG